MVKCLRGCTLFFIGEDFQKLLIDIIQMIQIPVRMKNMLKNRRIVLSGTFSRSTADCSIISHGEKCLHEIHQTRKAKLRKSFDIVLFFEFIGLIAEKF